MKHSIVIVDDHILIAKALGSIMSNFEDFEVLYECENGKELQEKFSTKKSKLIHIFSCFIIEEYNF